MFTWQYLYLLLQWHLAQLNTQHHVLALLRLVLLSLSLSLALSLVVCERLAPSFLLFPVSCFVMLCTVVIGIVFVVLGVVIATAVFAIT